MELEPIKTFLCTPTDDFADRSAAPNFRATTVDMGFAGGDLTPQGRGGEPEPTKFEVTTRFEPGEAGPLGFEFQGFQMYDGTSMLKVTNLSGRAATFPHACEGMLLSGIQVATDPRRDTTRLSEEATLDLVRDGRRPLTLFFEHPWQEHPDGKGGMYYYNSVTDQSVWAKPPEIAGLPVAAGSGNLLLLDRGVSTDRAAEDRLLQLANEWRSRTGVFAEWTDSQRDRFKKIVDEAIAPPM
jgi:hypothetical protein